MTRLTLIIVQSLLAISLLLGAKISYATSLAEVQKRWAKANYELTDKDQIQAFQNIIADLDGQLQLQPNNAELLIWRGITKSTLAGAKGGLGALKIAKASRKDFEAALNINDLALQGSAYTSLGTLYGKVPGWPVGFGSDKKAKKHLLKALEINPNGIDPNYFYAEFLFDNKKYQQAKTFLLKAQQAPPRPSRPLADKGRQQEVQELISKVNKKIK